MRSIAALLAGALLVAACDSTHPTVVPFQFAISNSPTSEPRAPQFTGTSGLVGLSGRFVTPTPCFSLAAAVRQEGFTLDVTITASPKNNGSCVQALAGFDYVLAISPSSTGSYHIIVHQVGDATGNTTFTGDVTVF